MGPSAIFCALNQALNAVFPSMDCSLWFTGSVHLDGVRKSKCRYGSTASRIGSAFHQSRIMQHDGACMAHYFVEGIHGVDLVACFAQCIHERRRKSVLEAQISAHITPSAAEDPARCGDGVLQLGSQHGVAGEYRGLSLGLALAAHGAINHDPAVVQQCHRRVIGVKGQPPGAQTVLLLRV